MAKGSIRHLLKFISDDDFAGVEPNPSAHLTGDQIAVACDDLYLHAILAQRIQSLGSIGERRVLFGLHFRVSNRKRTKALSAELLVRLLAVGERVLIYGNTSTFDLIRRQEREDALGRTFGDEQSIAARLCNNRKPPPLEVVWNLIQLLIFLDLLRLRALQDGCIQWAADPGLELTV